MNEELQERIEGYLDAVESSANTAGEFAAEQVPLVAQEYLAWVFWGGVVLLLAALVGILLSAVAAYVFWKTKDSLKHVEANVLSAMAALALATGSFIAAVPATYNIVKVTVAPRVVLIEKAAELIKESK